MSDTTLRDFGAIYPLAPRVHEVIHDASTGADSAPAYRIVAVEPRDADDYYRVTTRPVDVGGHYVDHCTVCVFRIRWSDYYKTWRVAGTWR